MQNNNNIKITKMKGRGGVRGVENKDILLSKETYYSVKRDPLQCQKDVENKDILNTKTAIDRCM